MIYIGYRDAGDYFTIANSTDYGSTWIETNTTYKDDYNSAALISMKKGMNAWDQVNNTYGADTVFRDGSFDLYYDRAPKSVNHRKGVWYLYQELEATDPFSSTS